MRRPARTKRSARIYMPSYTPVIIMITTRNNSGY